MLSSLSSHEIFRLRFGPGYLFLAFPCSSFPQLSSGIEEVKLCDASVFVFRLSIFRFVKVAIIHPFVLELPK